MERAQVTCHQAKRYAVQAPVPLPAGAPKAAGDGERLDVDGCRSHAAKQSQAPCRAQAWTGITHVRWAPRSCGGLRRLKERDQVTWSKAEKGDVQASAWTGARHVHDQTGSICTSLCWPHSGNLAHPGCPSRSRQRCNGISEARDPSEGRRADRQGSCAARQGTLPPRWQTSTVMYPSLRRVAAPYLRHAITCKSSLGLFRGRLDRHKAFSVLGKRDMPHTRIDCDDAVLCWCYALIGVRRMMNQLHCCLRCCCCFRVSFGSLCCHC